MVASEILGQLLPGQSRSQVGRDLQEGGSFPPPKDGSTALLHLRAHPPLQPQLACSSRGDGTVQVKGSSARPDSACCSLKTEQYVNMMSFPLKQSGEVSSPILKMKKLSGQLVNLRLFP